MWLRQLLGEFTGFGVKKQRPKKINGYVSTLHQNDTCHVITPSSERSKFSSRMPTNMGVDFLYNEKDGMKVWVRYCAVLAHLHPLIQSFFCDLASVPAQLDIETASLENIVLHPGRSFFNYENCLFKIVELGDDFALAQAIQTKNNMYVWRETYRFNDLNIIRQSIKDMLSSTD